jgi:hypothetical protein
MRLQNKIKNTIFCDLTSCRLVPDYTSLHRRIYYTILHSFRCEKFKSKIKIILKQQILRMLIGLV